MSVLLHRNGIRVGVALLQWNCFGDSESQRAKFVYSDHRIEKLPQNWQILRSVNPLQGLLLNRPERGQHGATAGSCVVEFKGNTQAKNFGQTAKIRSDVNRKPIVIPNCVQTNRSKKAGEMDPDVQ